MKYFLFLITSIFTLITNSSHSQYCGAVTTNVAINPTTTNQVTASYTSGRRAFNFTATAGCTYYFETCGLSTADTYLRLYSTGTGGTVLVTGDDNCGLQSSITWTCTTTGVYSILMTNWSCATLTVATSLRYRITGCSTPFNPCSSLTNITTCGTTNTFTISSGNGSYNPPSTSCGFTTPGQEKIYTFTPTVTGTYTINQLSSFGYIDWFFKPVSAGCSGTGWNCIDDLFGAVSSTSFTMTAGVQYYIMADPETITGGTVQFNLSCPTPPPANDNCINATSITLPYNSGVVSNIGSTDDGPASFCGQMGSNLWYKVVGDGQEYIATTCDPSSNFDTEIAVYRGSCGSMIEETCNDDDALCSSSGLRSTVTWCTLPGVEYYISVGYYTTGGGFGNFRLLVNVGPGCSTLPIELISFDGHLYNGDVVLEWQTATEHNNDYFIIERSYDGEIWNKIKEVDAAGNSTITLSYLVVDEDAKTGINYYRLTQVDFDGQYETFSPIAVQINNTTDCDYQFLNLSGQIIDLQKVPSGVYFKKCGDVVTKFVKY